MMTPDNIPGTRDLRDLSAMTCLYRQYLEFATRDLAKKHGTDLTIYSGGWGVLELEDINNNLVKIYLGLSKDKTVVPAPAITWKVTIYI